MEIPSAFLDAVRWYGQIDFDFEDNDVLELVEAVIEQLLYAIAPEGATVEQYWGYKSFQLAVKNKLPKNMNTVVYQRIVNAIRLLMVC